ncbi:MAG: glycosyltransferase family 39 protein [Candidatus Sulfotelmatobacter sp.]
MSRAGWWILLAGIGLRVVFFLVSANAGGDALERAALAARWVRHPVFGAVLNDAWLPLHVSLEGGLALLLGNVELASRLLSLLAGAASVWLVWKIARLLYGETAAYLSLLVFAFYSLHIGYSTTSSSEAPYLFCVLAGLDCFFNFQQTGRMKWLALSGICLTLGAAIRYESWVIIFGVGLVLFVSALGSLPDRFSRMRDLQSLLIFGLTAGAWPAFWMAFSWLKWRNPLYQVEATRSLVAQTVKSFPHSPFYLLAFTPGVLFLTLSPLAFAGAFYGLWSAIRRRPGHQFVGIVAAFALVQLYQVVSGGQLALARYSITLGTLLAVASGYGLEQIARRFSLQSGCTFYAVVTVVLLLNLGTILVLSESRWRFSDKFSSISPRLRFSRHIQDVGTELRRRLAPGDALAIDNYNVESNEVAEVAGLPLQTGDRVFDAALSRQDLPSDLWNFIALKRPKYLVYSEHGVLRPILPLPSGCSATPVIRGEMEFACLFANDIYSLYEIHYLTRGSAAARL